MSKVDWKWHGSAAAQAHAVAARVHEIIDAALVRRPLPLVAFTGGRSPIPVLQLLRGAKPDWQRVTVVPTDDRLVAYDNPLSNYTLLQRGLEHRGTRRFPSQWRRPSGLSRRGARR